MPRCPELRGIRRLAGDPVEGTAKRLAAGEIGAIYAGRMEYGPRALGARSILANPSRRETHDLLNTRLDRTEFMPFAPVIAADKAAEVFDVNKVNAYAMPVHDHHMQRAAELARPHSGGGAC